MLNPSPKNAFVSPRVHQGNEIGAGDGAGEAVFFTSTDMAGSSLYRGQVERGLSCWQSCQRGNDRRRIGDPAEDPALRGDHLQPDTMELGEIRTDTIGYDETPVSAIVR